MVPPGLDLTRFSSISGFGSSFGKSKEVSESCMMTCWNPTDSGLGFTSIRFNLGLF